MSESLATELLELIVDFVAGDPTQERTADLLSLCLSCKALVPCSQKHIFSDVVVYPPVKDRRPMPWLPPPEYLKRYEKTVSFLRTVLQHPHLANHVRSLTCNFTAQWLDIDATLQLYILQAFEHMSSIKSLTLAYQGPYESGTRFSMDEPSVTLSEWMTCIGAVLETRRLETLTLRNLSGYPGETILRSSHLRHLALCNTKLQPVISSEADDSVTAEVPQLQSLECDWISLKDGLTFLLSDVDTTVQPPVLVDAGHGSLISQVRVLDVAPTLSNQGETASLLSQTAALQTLLLRGE